MPTRGSATVLIVDEHESARRSGDRGDRVWVPPAATMPLPSSMTRIDPSVDRRWCGPAPFGGATGRPEESWAVDAGPWPAPTPHRSGRPPLGPAGTPGPCRRGRRGAGRGSRPHARALGAMRLVRRYSRDRAAEGPDRAVRAAAAAVCGPRRRGGPRSAQAHLRARSGYGCRRRERAGAAIARCPFEQATGAGRTFREVSTEMSGTTGDQSRKGYDQLAIDRRRQCRLGSIG
jgi:hypothetical protein